MNLLEEATRLLAAGLRPIPVMPGRKCPGDRAGMWGERHPTQKDWKTFQRRAPTEAELSAWFADGSAGMGTVIPAGVIVIDFDGGKAAEKLLDAQGVVLPPQAPKVRSGSGGYHTYMKLPPGARDFAKLPGAKFLHSAGADGKPCKPFVEVLTVNNFVVLPPTVHPDSGRRYEWVVDLDGPIPEAPASLLALIAKFRGVPAAAAKRTASGNEPGWVEELSKGTGPGTHDDSMTKLAGYYLGRRLPVGQVIDIIDSGYGRRSWQVAGVPHRIPMADIKRVVESVARAEACKSRIEESEFQLLGYEHETYFYLSKATGQVVELTARNHDKHNLQRLASLRHWDRHFGGEHGVCWDAAQAALLDAQHKVGIFDLDRFRGRGAWWDEELGSIMHTGSHIIAGGKSIPVRELPRGRNVYELAKPLDVGMAHPLGADEAREAMYLLNSLNWEHPHHGRLAAGWAVAAAVCGALEWRPHVWFSGPTGSGKSWMMDSIIKPLLGNLALVTQSETTEAGLRQTLRHDARPVIFDEAEAQGQRGDTRMANVLALIRQASSETGGTIIKGGADGAAKTYSIRSCFAMSSINVSAYQAADRNRITVLELRIPAGKTQHQRDADFAKLCDRVNATLTDEFCAGFRARCLTMIPTIRRSAAILSVAASGAIGSRRLGDQVGALLAGAYSLVSDSPPTPELARELVADQDMTQQVEIRSVSDECELLSHILEAVVPVAGPHGRQDRSLASLVRECRDAMQSEGAIQEPRDAADALALVGLKATQKGLVVANSHRGVRKLLDGTHWGKDWARVLRRLQGAEASGVVRIGDVVGRATTLPWEQVP